jgi:general secretion pathway protein D
LAFPRSLVAGRITTGVLSAALLILPWSLTRLSATPASDPGAGPSASTHSIRVSGITIQSGKNGEAVVDVATSGTAQFRVSRLDNPERLVVDFEGARTSTLQGTYRSECSLVKRVRVGQFRSDAPPIVRVVADLHGDPAADVHLIPDGVRIVLRPRGSMRPIIPVSEPLARPRPAEQAPQSTSQAAPAQQPTQPPVAPRAVPTVAPSASPSVFFVTSPFKSLKQNQKLLDTLGLRIVLTLDYKTGTADEAPWKTKGLAGVVANRLFFKPLGGGNYRTIELAVTESPQRGYDIAAYGSQEVTGSPSANPDFAQLQTTANEEINKMAQAPPPTTDLTQLGYETYYLSYVAADRAMGMLKTFGYTTFEFNEQSGDSLYDKIYNPVRLGTGHPPIIIKLIDSTKTSLMEPPPTQAGIPGQPVVAQMPQQAVGGFGAASSAVPQIGGTFLQGTTSGEPQQRLLILYDKTDPDSLQSLINLLQTTVDVPARQIMIEALVIELNANRGRQLGVTFEGADKSASDYGTSNAFGGGDPTAFLPFQFTFTKGSMGLSKFTATLQAMITKGEAQVLSNPSVLVLDDRQARIQIGQQVPVSQTTFTGAGVGGTGFSYFPVGIVLNLRPRINDDGTEVTMQTETIVSAINTTATAAQETGAPVVDNRQVQSIVRVANNTPFIIGGLVSTNDSTNMSGIPLLSQIPGIGALFRSTKISKESQEVIIVITPHVVPLQDKYFSYVIPKDSSQFDRLQLKLYRNAYRIRGEDLFDLGFVKDSNVYKQLVARVKEASASDPDLKKTEPFSSVVAGGAPGEDILVRRMLWGIIHRTGYDKYITPDRIILFKDNPSAVGGTGFDIAFLNRELEKLKGGENTLGISLEAQPKGTSDRSFVPPKAIISFVNVDTQSFFEKLAAGNSRNPDGTPKDWEVLLKSGKAPPGVLDATPLEVLQGALVLKQVLELNTDMPLTLEEFHIGRQIIFPSQEELQSRYHQVDRQVAELFYEIYNYYPAFEQEFNRETRQMNAELDKINHQR